MTGAGRDPTKKKKRIAVTIVSSFLLIGMVVAVTVGIALSEHPSHKGNEPSTSMKAIKNICHNTEYKEECVRSLEKEAGNASDPKELIQAAFRSVKKKIQEAAKKSGTIQELAKDPLTRMAIDQCMELANMSISELERSSKEVANFDSGKIDEILLDLKTWLSAAYTYQSTCLDGFEGTTGHASEKMKAALKSSMEMTTNGVTMVSELHKAFMDYNITGVVGRRRLLEDEDDDAVDPVPSWVDKGTRRLLTTENALDEEKPDMVVAKDGSGQFKTINDAIKAIPSKRPAGKHFVIHIKEGIYEEQVNISSALKNLVFIGDGPTKTRITCNRNYKQNITTYHTATLAISANNFTAKNIGIENSAGPENHQAVALRASGDNAVFYNCAMDGYQDTVYAHAKRQFYRDCTISGTIDFVFGNAQSIFQNCTFVVRKPMENQACIVTAQGRMKKNEPTAIVLQGCRIVADPAYYPVRFKNKAYLARPWKEYSRAIIMHSFIDDLIAPEGYLPWQGDFALKTLVYVEHENNGPGADKSKRVKWHGIRSIKAESADKFTPESYLGGADFIKEVNVPFVPGRMPAAESN